MVLNQQGQADIQKISEASSAFHSDFWWSCRISSKSRFFPALVRFLESGSFHREVFGNAFQFLKQVYHAGRLISQIVYLRFRFSHLNQRLKNLPSRPLALCKSFAYPSSFQKGQFVDPFLKDLIPQLQSYQVLHLIDPQMKLKDVPKESEDSSCMVVPHLFLVPVSSLVVAMGRIFLEFLRLTWFPKSIERQNELYDFYRWELIGASTLNNLIFKEICHGLRKYGVTPALTFLTYENNAWERMFLIGHKEAFPNVRTFGIQHSVLPEASLNMFIGEAEARLCPQPDVLLTTGPLAQEILFSASKTTSAIQTLGTTRFSYLHELKPQFGTGEYDLLVVLEGVPMAAEMVEKLMSEKAGLGRRKILLRAHPAFPFEQLQRYLKKDIRQYRNFSVSSEPNVATDILRSSFVLYLGSASALEAIKLGRPVIAYKAKTRLDFDPLKDLSVFKVDWDVETELEKEIQKLESLSLAEKKAAQAKASAYVDDFFAPLSLQTVQTF